MIRIENLSKSFGNQTVLKNINLELPKNQMIGIVGPDGSGKTTLLRLISGLLKPTEGKITVRGADTIENADQIHEFSSYMPQRFGLYEDLTVDQNLNLYASLHGMVDENRKEELLKFTALAPFLNREAFALSGGMKQKLGLACALIHKPELLILDEPSVGVDPISRRELWKMVQTLLKEGVSVLWSTTYLDEAAQCDRVVLLNEGQILYQGPPQELTKRVEGRVFRLFDEEKRKRLFEIESRPGVVDALIQGNAIRIVGQSIDGAEPTAPRLEDAFVDILGGIKINEWKWSEAAPVSKAGNEDAVVANELVKKFDDFTAVNRVSFSVKRGEIFGFLGPNGAGKSTTFKMLSGLLKPTSGTATINGIDVQKNPTLSREQLGYMAQKFSLYGNLSVKQNLEFFSGIYPSIGTVEERLKLFHLENDKNRNAESLSLGFKQKLSLAVATIHWPDVLFLDEPTSGMDPVSRRNFWSQMNGLVRKGKTILISTHFMDEAENCDRIGLIYRGLMIHLDTPDHLKELAKTEENQNPTLEDAFIKLIQEFDEK